jgi:hypothetical protein
MAQPTAEFTGLVIMIEMQDAAPVGWIGARLAHVWTGPRRLREPAHLSGRNPFPFKARGVFYRVVFALAAFRSAPLARLFKVCGIA